MKERPIIFSGAMIPPILDGRKTQTRRILKPQPTLESGGLLGHRDLSGHFAPHVFGPCLVELAKRPYAAVGDRLWVRETFAAERVGHGRGEDAKARVFYRASCEDDECDLFDEEDGAIKRVKIKRWTPPIHMPRVFCRLVLEVLDVRVERLHDISEDDARAEGIDTSVVTPSPTGIEPIRAKNYGHARDVFADLWRLINGAESWDANPWVWAITFRALDGADGAAR